MRRNSGDDESRNRHLDPTTKERERERGKSGAAVLDRDANKGEVKDNRGQRTTEMGSNARKSR
ncbi:MAG: hypothetical protein ACR2JJ_02035 [Sphingomicrobium sp.]